MNKFKKQFIEVTATFKDGNITPQEMVWVYENGDEEKFTIDKVIGEPMRAAAIKGGGIGLRYECRIQGKIRYLYLDGYEWFVEVVDHS